MSGHNPAGRFVLAEMKRRWTLAEKRAVVAESNAGSTSISAVARRHGIAPALLFRWRRELSGGRSGGAAKTRLLPVCLPAPADVGAPVVERPAVVEIELKGSGLRLRVEVPDLDHVLGILEAR
jgi:transposase